jgi:AcrR family transcriptional regulator
MSRNSRPHARRLDARVRRTRDALGDALVELMHEKPYAAIQVQEVLARAEVGRATFYAHFADKDDLFASDVDDFFALMASHLSRCGERSRRLAPVREFLEHLQEARAFVDALGASGKLHDVLALGRAHFARGIEQRLRELCPERRWPAAQRALCAEGLAGAFLAQLDWWRSNGMPLTPAQMDERFHALAWGGLDGRGL